MRALKTEAKKAGTDVSNALGNAISPKQASNSITKLSQSLTQLSVAAKVPAENFRITATAISNGMDDVRQKVGLTKDQFQKLNEQMLQTSAQKNAEKALRDIASAAGLSQKEMMALGKQLGYTSDQMNKMKATSGEMNKAINTQSSALGKISSAWGSVITAAGAYFSLRAIKDLIVDSTLLAARVETLGIVMKVVGANAGYTSAQMESQAKAVAALGITTQEARTTVTRLVQAQIDLGSATKLARIAQDAAVIGNTNSSEALGRLVYGIQTAQVEVLRTIGINVNFEQSYSRMAQTLGKTAAELTEQEKVQARLNTVMEAGGRIAGTYEMAMGTMGKQLTSMPRFIENVKEQFGELFKPALSAVITQLTKDLEDLGNWFKEQQENGNVEKWSEEIRSGVQGITGAIKDLWNIAGEIPVEALEYGVVGYLLYGKKAGAVLAGLAVGIDQLNKAGAKVSGMSLEEYSKKVNEASDLIYGGKPQYNLFGKIRLNAPSESETPFFPEGMPVNMAAINEAMLESIRENAANAKTAKAVERSEKEWKSLISLAERQGNILVDSEAYTGEQILENAKWLAAQREETAGKLLASELTVGEQVLAADKELNRQRAAYVETYADAMLEADVRMSEEGIKKATENYQDRWRIERALYADIAKLTNNDFELKRESIRNQANLYKQAGMDRVMVAEWAALKIREIDEAEALRRGDFWDGMRVAYAQDLRDQKRWGEQGAEIWRGIFGPSGAITGTLTSFFEDVFNGQLKKAKDYFNSFKSAIINMFAKMIAEMIAMWVAARIYELWNGTGTSTKNPVTGVTNTLANTAISTGISTGAKAAYNYLFPTAAAATPPAAAAISATTPAYATISATTPAAYAAISATTPAATGAGAATGTGAAVTGTSYAGLGTAGAAAAVYAMPAIYIALMSKYHHGTRTTTNPFAISDAGGVNVLGSELLAGHYAISALQDAGLSDQSAGKWVKALLEPWAGSTLFNQEDLINRYYEQTGMIPDIGAGDTAITRPYIEWLSSQDDFYNMATGILKYFNETIGPQIWAMRPASGGDYAAEGAVINEPMIAFGKSGRKLIMGEAGTEYIVPENKMGGQVIQIQLNMNGKAVGDVLLDMSKSGRKIIHERGIVRGKAN